MPRTGLILFAHGSRDPRWREPFVDLEKRVGAKLPQTAVRAAYLEGCEPTLDAVVDQMATNGVRIVTVTPMFLAVGTHSRDDFPKIARRLSETHPGITIRWTEVLGEWDEVREAMAAGVAKRVDEAQ